MPANSGYGRFAERVRTWPQVEDVVPGMNNLTLICRPLRMAFDELTHRLRAAWMDAEAEALLGAYFGTTPGADFARAFAAMQCASLLREAMWSMVSELHLDAPDVDYVAYTQENLARLDAALDSYKTKYGMPS